MLISLQLIFGVLLLYYGSDRLVWGSARLALRLGVPSLVIGLTIVAYGTSLPEQVVSMKAGFDGLGDIAVGNAIGSNIFNIAVILGLSAIVRPLHLNGQLLRIDIPIMIGVSLALSLLLVDHRIGRLEGCGLFAGIILYTVLTIRRGRGGQEDDSETAAAVPGLAKGSVVRPIINLTAGLILLVIGARLLVAGAVELAKVLGVSQAVIGLTIVAAGTSLPELATSVVATFRKEHDIAIGNIVGSNIFNILSVLGLSSLMVPLNAKGIGGLDLLFMLLTAGLFVPFLLGHKSMSRIWGVFSLLMYGVYLYLLWPE